MSEKHVNLERPLPLKQTTGVKPPHVKCHLNPFAAEDKLAGSHFAKMSVYFLSCLSKPYSTLPIVKTLFSKIHCNKFERCLAFSTKPKCVCLCVCVCVSG
ncbi:hypothetical protein ILYODFUR_016698 [Ilyodon furcidens]|uniref:Uncharacterized protein n=1 Tax=Ilyodon furcidens TaxID=33524 RepID=A0ABV0TCF8_9TELE